MAVRKVDIEQFLDHAAFHPVLDVRSPSEYNHAHIPGAISLPLFSDEERAVVGTLYKQRSREDAIKEGVIFFGPKMRPMIEKVEQLLQSVNWNKIDTSHSHFIDKKCVLVHCWRGGMRSGAVAWLLDLYGFKIITLNGGYKFFRRYVLQMFERPIDGKILGGYTGSGKSHVLHELAAKGQSIIDLEGLAHHKGSAFGAIGQPPQPSPEMFENKLALQLRKALSLNRPVWFEDESQRIGSVNIPQPLWLQMRRMPIFFLRVPFEHRLDHIVKEYGNIETEKLINAIIRISKRLGGLETKTAVQHIIEGNVRDSFAVLLKYYDKWYEKGLHNRDQIDQLLVNVNVSTVNAHVNANAILENSEILR